MNVLAVAVRPGARESAGRKPRLNVLAVTVDAYPTARYLVFVSDQARSVLADALRLRADERAEVAAELLRSLDEEESQLPPEEVERLWAEELTRRAQRALRGESVGRDLDDAVRDIEAKLQTR